jgi:hypothetical protein
VRIRLGDEDREKLGCPEWLPFDLSRLGLVEAEEMDRHGLLIDSFGGWVQLVQGDPLIGADGKPVTAVTADGATVTRYRVRPLVQRAIVWAALRRAGKDLPFDGFDIDASKVEFGPDEDLGKDEEPPPPSAPAKRSPTRRRATSPRSPRSAT